MFLAHTSKLKDGQYHILDQYDKQKVLVNHNGYKLISNICPHQNSLISTNDGEGNRVCPYHNWSFTIDGHPITSGRTDYYCKNQSSLNTQPVYTWNNLLFSTKVDFKVSLDLSNLTLIESRVDYVDADYRNIMDLFLDVDHIQTVHRGVYDLIGITNTEVNWTYYDNGSIQEVPQGAYWISIYPYTMIEWQKGSLFITVTKSITTKTSKVFVYKYGDKNNYDNYELNQKIWEMAWSQDKKQAELITEFAVSNLEPQKLHYRNFGTQWKTWN